MSLNHWLPVPSTGSVIRLVGATAPPSPSARPGTIVGNAKHTAAEAEMVLCRKSRREESFIVIDLSVVRRPLFSAALLLNSLGEAASIVYCPLSVADC